jgi:hypothetical protein
MQRGSDASQIRDRSKHGADKVPVLQRITIVLRCARDMADVVCLDFDRTLDWAVT